MANIYTVRCRKNLPPPQASWLARWWQAKVLYPLNKLSWKLMGIPPPDYEEGGYNEGFHSFSTRVDAEAMMREKAAPGWFIEETPLDDADPLPDESVTFGNTVFPIGKSICDNGTRALPVAVSQSNLKSSEDQLQSLLDQTGRMLAKNQARARSA